MNTILNVMSDTEIYLVLIPICLVIAVVAIYRTAVSNKTPDHDKH